jgi:hypothetical protein
MKNVDVVIVSWAKTPELLEVTKTGLNSLFNSNIGSIAFHAYIVESNPDIVYEDMDEYQMNGVHSIKTIHPTVPFGYNRYLNIGRRLGNSKYVALCNSDLTYESGWADEIIKIMETNSEFTSASPWCPQTQGPNHEVRDKLYKGYTIRRELAGWCIFQQRKIYDIIGELNEGVDFWYSDDIYADQLKLKNIPHILVCNSIVNHHSNDLGKTGSSLSDETQWRITKGEHVKYIEALNKLNNQ